jgi:hypothetical protein
VPESTVRATPESVVQHESLQPALAGYLKEDERETQPSPHAVTSQLTVPGDSNAGSSDGATDTVQASADNEGAAAPFFASAPATSAPSANVAAKARKLEATEAAAIARMRTAVGPVNRTPAWMQPPHTYLRRQARPMDHSASIGLTVV